MRECQVPFDVSAPASEVEAAGCNDQGACQKSMQRTADEASEFSAIANRAELAWALATRHQKQFQLCFRKAHDAAAKVKDF